MPLPPTAPPTAWQTLFSPRMLQCLLMGFASGLPQYFLVNLLPPWLVHYGVNLDNIALFALVQIPYSLKFLWAPLLDNFSLNRLGRRRSWMLVCQIILLVMIAAFGWINPGTQWQLTVVLALALSLFSATQDIAIDALRRQLLPDAELGLGTSVHINAYRLASLIPGSLALILSDKFSWPVVFSITALFMLVGVVLTLGVREPAHLSPSTQVRDTWKKLVREPFVEFIRRVGSQHAVWILAFMLLYKLGDSLATALATPFYLQMGFSRTDIGQVAKNAGLWSNIVGGMLGGLWMVRHGINRALWVFGVLQAVTILGFAYLAYAGPFASISWAEKSQLGMVVALEALGTGMGTAALVAFITRATNPFYAATQFALFTSITSLPRTVLNAYTGALVQQLGWFNFFLLCFALALPGLLLLPKLAVWTKEPTPQQKSPQHRRND